jgi:hypothetical protein
MAVGESVTIDVILKYFNQQKSFMLKRAPQLNESIEAHFSRDFPYVWFSDVPFYRESTLDAFFADIRYEISEEFVESLEYGDFDHLIYLNWLSMTSYFPFIRIRNLSPLAPQSWAWSQNVCDLLSWKNILPFYQPIWINSQTYRYMQEDVYAKNMLNYFYLVYHLDRNC